MANIFEFEGFRPVIHESSFVHPDASIIGNVIIGKNCYIGSGAAVRGDFGSIIIEDGCNIQENCIVHMFPGVEVRLQENSHVGHSATIHGASIGRDVLIGMSAVVMDEVIVGNGSIIGALSFVPSRMIIPDRKVVVGNPAKIIKDVSDEMFEWKKQGTKLYQELAARCLVSFKECEPLREIPQDRQSMSSDYKIWKSK